MSKGILIVDDMDFFRQWLRQELTQRGWRVTGEAGDGEECVRKYGELAPDLVILDLLMPRMDGFAALKAIRDADPAAKVIICSIAGHRENVIRSRRLGAMDFLAKPVTEERLFKAVTKAIGAPSSGD